MTQPYKPVSWTEEPMSVDKLNQMTNNDQWLFENTPRMRYSAYSLTKPSGLKILSTYAFIPRTLNRTLSRNVYFGSFFSVGCQPILAVSPVSTGTQRRFFTAVNGIGRAVPDHTGATITLTASELNPKNDKILHSVYVHVIAVGW
jgi:hypothetical protein